MIYVAARGLGKWGYFAWWRLAHLSGCIYAEYMNNLPMISPVVYGCRQGSEQSSDILSNTTLSF